MLYSVMAIVPVNVRVDAVEALSQEDAVAKALDFISENRRMVDQTFHPQDSDSGYPFRGQTRIRYCEINDGEVIVAALVDNCGDVDFSGSKWFVPSGAGYSPS